ncbi:hypothetical protein SLA2020_377350 [Shorea laevis]
MPSFRPSPNVHLLELPPFTVADLIIPGERSWNINLLEDLFSPSTAQHILSIHLPQISSFDKWSCVPSPSGQFSVKLAHELSLSLDGHASPFSPEVWQSLWV